MRMREKTYSARIAFALRTHSDLLWSSQNQFRTNDIEEF
jgi:hypothetical protein